MRNRTEFVLTMLGAAHAGLVTVLLSTRQQKPEIAYVLTDCGARLLIHEAALAMQTKMFVGRLAQTVHAYPTWSMAMQQAALQFFGTSAGFSAKPISDY